MKWILVEWLDEGEKTVIPASWLVTPTTIPTVLPVDGMAYWKRPSDQYGVRVLAASSMCILVLILLFTFLPFLDSKKSLTPLVDEDTSKLIATHRKGATEDETSGTTTKRRKIKATAKAVAIEEVTCEVQKKKNKSKCKMMKNLAECSTAEMAYNDILTAAIPPQCKKCRLLEEELSDSRCAIEAKKAQIAHLQKQLEESQSKELSLGLPPYQVS